MARTQSRDTSPEIEALLFARLRRMSPAERMAHVGALGRLAEEVALAGLRARYPAASDHENRLRLLARRIDRETMIRVYGWDPDERGR